MKVGSRSAAAEVDLRRLPWPLHTIDFEASSLEPGSYPIEVGICRWMSPDHPREGWSTLIRPPVAWVASGSWTGEAEAIHGIQRDDLRNGISATETVVALNAIVGDNVVFCDGGRWDFGWARRLVLAAGVMNRYRMGDYAMLRMRCPTPIRAGVDRWLARTPARHRARDDAERLMKALAHGLSVSSSASIDIVPEMITISADGEVEHGGIDGAHAVQR